MMEQQMALFARLHAEAPAPIARQDLPGVTSYYELRYATVPGFRPLALDLHLPAQLTAPAPVLVWVHGGGWQGGTRTMGHAIDLVRYGFAVAQVQYRLSGEATFPAQVHDLKGAVRWLRANAATYQLDPDRIAGWGASAGAHLVCMVGLTAGNAELEGDVGGNLEQSSSLQAVIDFFGPSDFFAMAGGAPPRPGPNPLTSFLGYTITDRPDAARQAMPVTFVHAGAPPFLIVHGDADPLVPHAQSEALHAALTRAGATSTLLTLPGAIHEDPAFWSDSTRDHIRQFLASAGLVPGSGTVTRGVLAAEQDVIASTRA
jgi:acetyl esterase/lipase